MTEDETFVWHESEHAPGVGDGQGSLELLQPMGSQKVGQDS